MLSEIEERIVEDYRAWLSSWSPSESTITARVQLASNRLRAWGTAGFTTDAIQKWLSGYADWSRSTYYSNLRDLCAWMVAAGHLTFDPTEDVHKPKRPQSLPKPLTDADVDRALAAATGDTRAYMLLGLFAGLRAHEIAKIRGEDVTETHIYVLGKGRKRAAIPTHPDLWALAQTYPRSGHWFPSARADHLSANSVSQRVHKIHATLGIEGAAHRWRHTYGTRLLRAGVNIRIVQKLMRHSSLATTEAYLGVADDEMSEAIARLSA